MKCIGAHGCIPAHTIQTLPRYMKQSKQRSELAYRTRQLPFAAVTSGPNRAPDCLHHANLLLAVAAAVATACVTAVEVAVAVAVTDAAGRIDMFWNLLSADLVL